MIGGMHLRDSAQLPKHLFDAFGQRLKALAEAERDRFDMGVGEHKVIDQMGKRLPSNDNAQIAQMRKIGLGALPWCMDLLKDHLTLRPIQRAPLGDMSAQRDDRSRSVTTWMLLDEQGEQDRGLQRGITLPSGLHPIPIPLKGILARQPSSGSLELRGRLSHLLILAPCPLAHPRFCGGLLLRLACCTGLHIQLNLRYPFSWTLSLFL